MSKTKSKMPVEAYIYKWLVNRLGYREHLELTARMPPVKHRPSAVYEHFKAEGMKEITVLGYYPNRFKLYSLHQNLVSLFNQDMMAYTQNAVRLGLPAKTSIEDFLRSCKIDEQELAIGTAYKRWQRQGKQEIPGLRIN